jgi:hypothetical protein
MNTAVSLDVTHLIVAAVALLGPLLLKRLQAPATPAPAPSPAPAGPTAPLVIPILPPEVAALLPLHGVILNFLLQQLQQQTVPQPQPAK